MTGLTIWEQRALAEKDEAPPEAGHTKIFDFCNNSEEIQDRFSYGDFFIYWDDEVLNGTFKHLYDLKFQIGKFSGQVLPSPLWQFNRCRFRDFTIAEKQEDSEEYIRSEISKIKEITRSYMRKKRQLNLAKQFISSKDFKKLINLVFILFVLHPIKNLFLDFIGSIKSGGQSFVEFVQSMLRLASITGFITMFDSFYEFSNKNKPEASREILVISQVLGIITADPIRRISLRHHILPQGIFISLLLIIIFPLLFVIGFLSENLYSLSDYLIERIMLAYGVTDLWGNIWTALNSSLGNQNHDIYAVLIFSLLIRIAVDLFAVLFLFLLSIGIPLKIAARLRDSKFSESACALESLRILIDLEREDALVYPLQKKYLMIRMSYLSSISLLIPKQYPSNRYRRSWINNQFRSISAFIQDRQSWLYAPGETTLQDLRRDYHMLAKMYIDGSYGSFPYSEEFQPEPVPVRQQQSQTIAQWLGFLLPLGLIVSAFFFPNSLPTPLQSPEIQEVFIWLGTTWLLIGIDKYLNLGVLDSIVDLASGLKGLK